MKTLRKMRALQWAVIAAAYAFLLNVALTSAIQASLPPQNFDPLQSLCLNSSTSVQGTSTQDIADQDTSPKRVISCPLCLAHNVFSLIAPAVPVVQPPLSAATIVELFHPDAEHALSVSRNGWARAPPSLLQ